MVLSPRAACGAERRGGGVWGGVSPPREKGQRGSRSDPRCHPVWEAPRPRKRLRRDSRRGNSAGCFPHGLNNGAFSTGCSRRGAPRGRGVGRGFPSPRKKMARIAQRSAPSPRGGSAPHAYQLAPAARFVREIVRGVFPKGWRGASHTGCQYADSKQLRPDPAVHWSRSATRPSGPRQFWVWVHQK